MQNVTLRTILAIVTLQCVTCAGADGVDPAAYRESVMQNKHLAEEGESFCWHASFGAGNFLTAYEAFKDAKWLDEAATYYDFYLTKLKKDPDGYEGWIGPTITNTPEIQEDALVGDAILCRHLVAFAEIVMKDEALKKRFGEKAQKYIDLSTRMMWEKWNKRGCYYEDAAGWGSYRTHGRSIDMKTGKWVERPGTMMTQPFNKSADAAIVLLHLWRITGKPEYRERVEKIFGRGKMLLQHYPGEDRVVWAYWTPHAPYDMEGRAPRHWVGVHPERPGYQAGEVAMFVEVYDSGLVFEQKDIERIIRTNLWMAKGDGKNAWRSADGSTPAGILWSSLIRFDETLRKMYLDGLEKKTDATSQIHQAHFKNVTSKRLNWDRLHVKDPAQVKVTSAPLQPGKFLTLALPIPNVIETENNERMKFATQTRDTGTLKIELLDAAGKEVLGTLATIEVLKEAQFNAPRWDGTNPKTKKKEHGEYRIRWTLSPHNSNELLVESRVERVWVKPGTKRPSTRQKELAAGQSIKIDFESPLEARWHVEGATLSEEQAHGGNKSLKLIEGQSAVLTFGEEDDLPVKITMWVFDNGTKLGKTNGTGGGWGVKTVDGDKFCIRTCWRAYLGGDEQYAWFNTGESQWYSPRSCKIERKEGWSEWVFDLSDPAAPKITANGKPAGNLLPQYTPKGAVAVYLLGGDKHTGPTYIDDVSVERK
ncbi:MAG TPA: hypothetical protein VEJ63_22020 [Planctomycetota bacterium]|nr:hypothetical protein [Planctomycetota bacterium]